MSLVSNYRPIEFSEIVGNKEVVSSINSILDRGTINIPRSWLLTGPSGCGKTTLARIIATYLGCKGDDLSELDSANFRGVDTIRTIRDQMNYAPTQSSCRIWILDECHQITKDAQEAILKALEDTPPHVFFILCTTEPQKLKTTLKNRCISFEVEPVSDKDMTNFLKEIVECEEKKCNKDVINAITINSLGSCRTALQLLETVIDLPIDKMKQRVKTVIERQSAVIDLCRALFKGEPWSAVSKILKRMDGDNPENIRLAIMGYCSAVLLNSVDSAQAYIVMDSFKFPLYTNGKSGLVHMAYEATQESNPIPF